MAEDTAQEKTEEATQHRRDEALKKGDVVHSREVVTAAVVLATVLTLPVFHPMFVRTFHRVFTEFLRFDQLAASDVASFQIVMLRSVLSATPLLLAVFGVIIVAGVASNLLQLGWRVSAEKLEPKPERLNPAKGLERILGRRAAAEAVRTVAKFLIVGGVAVFTIRGNLGDIMGLHSAAPSEFIPALAMFIGRIAWRVALLMIGFAVLDYAYQRWDWNRRLRMSRQELKEELKEREGNPLIKQRIRGLQMEQARRRMMAEVPTATAVVTNPTHCAVALRYIPGEDVAPVVVAKGVDHIAAKIREIAGEHGVPCVEDRPLAWTLYRTVKLGREVPAHLFRAVAEVMAYVFRLGGWERIDKVRNSLRPKRGND
ncbi:flagellar biosynthesis protein FlhB [Candidatus Sumerlaeota bacterium]|nr:flagellar biosynthesis protein FlhB [Candidatus Sumerlaeota bacterium]